MNLDDPKLTAYALGEITDPADIAEVETWLAQNAEGRTFVTDTREMAAFLSEKLHAPMLVELTEEQRDSIIGNTNIIPLPTNHRRPWSIIALTALAACLAAAPLLPWAELLRLRDGKTPAVALNEKPMTLQMPSQLSRRERVDANTSLALDQMLLPAPLDANKSNSAMDERASASADRPAFAARAKEPSDGVADVAASAPPVPAMIADVSSPWTSGVAGGTGAVSSKSAPRAARPEAIGNDAFYDRDRPAFDQPNTEAYDSVTENDFLAARENPLSTFSIDVDTASYANVRRMLNDGQLPPKGAVRIEEMLNYFTYDYAKPEGAAPFSINLEVATCPWQPEHRLVRIGLKGREIPAAERKPANLVFLIDVSGSMDEPNKLPLLKQSLRLLVDQLGENDRVALTVYAGSSGLVLPSTANKDAIRAALDNLKAGGSTNGASGIQLAYQEAVANFQKEGINRVILATDGDFNVGVTNQSDLSDLITDKAKSGVFLSVLGFGTGNVKDSTMEKLADKGNGNYAYIDSLKEGKKVLVEQMGGTLVAIAKDVKIQVEFNPAVVSNYRLVGYENRALKKEDFADDKKDAGEIGAGHTVTALYEVIPLTANTISSKNGDLKYQPAARQSEVLNSKSEISPEMLTVKLRYKEPSGDVSKLLEVPLVDDHKKLEAASKDFQFASAVAEFAQLLRKSEHRQLASWESLLSRAADAKGEDRGGYRAEFIELAKKAEALTKRNDS